MSTSGARTTTAPAHERAATTTDRLVLRAGAVHGTGTHGDPAQGGSGADDAVDAVLRASLEDCRRRAARLGRENDVLWREIARSLDGGKRFRSALVLGTHDALGGGHPRAAVVVAAGFELLHTAFLVHDDLIDNDTVRRGRPNLAAVMRDEGRETGLDPVSAHRWSQAAALLAGDLTLSLAHRMFAEAALPAPLQQGLTELVDETLLVSAGGELVDTAFGLRVRSPDLAEAFTVAESKTAMYSFRAPLRAGALLAGADPGLLERLDGIGVVLGRSFQLVDDLLGVFAPEERIGKSNLSDLREGKMTPLMLRARELPVWNEISAHVGQAELDQAGAARVRGALARSQAPDDVAAWVREDLARVREDARGLPGELGAVVCAVASEVGRTLDTVVQDIEEARCSTD